MVQTTGRPRLGPYILTKELAPGVLGERWLALRESDLASCVVVKLHAGVRDWNDPTEVAGVPAWRGRFEAACGVMSSLKHPHLLPIESFGLDEERRPYVVVPFTGDQEGVVTLDHLLRLKGGFLGVDETKRALEQLLGAVVHAHEQGTCHGELSMGEVAVDQRGRVAIELYGVARMLSSLSSTVEADQAREVRSICEIGYQMLTGLRAQLPIISPSRVVLGLHQTWEDFFETGLGTPGFTTAEHAMSALRACRVHRNSNGVDRSGWTLRSLIGG